MSAAWPLHDASAAFFDQLARASIDGGLFVLAVLVLVRLVPSLPARAVAAAWWLASVRFLVGLAWAVPVALPVLPAGLVERQAIAASALPCLGLECAESQAGAAPPADAVSGSTSSARRADPHPAEPSPERNVDPAAVATLAWAAITLAVVGRTVRRTWRTRRLLREAGPAGPRLQAIAGEAAGQLGLRRMPPVRVTREGVPPQVIWLGRPTVL
ncbi:MAG: hypothetical protein MUF60_05180, partial [Vicinamibacterales bacterium]|nr:hypothetical protein [Vicinamibacterales bacterium]